MGQVLFMHTFYYPGKEEMYRRAKLQEDINSMHIRIDNEVNKLTAYRRFYHCVYNKRVNEEMRKQIKVVKCVNFTNSVLSLVK